MQNLVEKEDWLGEIMESWFVLGFTFSRQSHLVIKSLKAATAAQEKA